MLWSGEMCRICRLGWYLYIISWMEHVNNEKVLRKMEAKRTIILRENTERLSTFIRPIMNKEGMENMSQNRGEKQ